MIFAAGYGTRLRPLTDAIPKALVPIGETTMLEIVARRLIAAGAGRIVVNVHHHADQIEELIRFRNRFGVDVVVSDERARLLDTGGGLARAAPFLTSSDPFLLHNVDVFSDIDLRRLAEAHRETSPLATLVVNTRQSSRHLLFDDHGLIGYGNDATGLSERVRAVIGRERRYAFCGIHAISPRIFDLITEQGAFSIIALYMRLAMLGERIIPHVALDDELWIDIGSHLELERAREIARTRQRSS